MKQELKVFLKKFLDIFVLLVVFELLSHYPLYYTLPKPYANHIGLEKTFSGSQIKFLEKS